MVSMENHLDKLNIDLSYACNISCTTCLCPQIDAGTGAPALSLETARRVIDEFVAMGGRFLGLLGGEPLLVAHVYDVVAYAAGAGLNVAITTNGMAATPANSRRLLACGLSSATVSVDGDRSGHEMIRGKGTFEKTIRGARNLSAAARDLGRRDFRLGLHVTISRANVRAFAGIIYHAAEIGPGTSVSVQYFSRLEPGVTRQMERLLDQSADHRRNHWNLPQDLLLTEDDIPPLRAGIAAMKQSAHERNVPLCVDPALDEAFDARRLMDGTFALSKPCHVFETAMLVGPDGRVGSCPMLTHFSLGQVNRQSLEEILASEPFERLRGELRCGYLPVCQSCCRHVDLA
jgi:radical SAM protein with 4Fe4S-binding SPASM domain